MGHGGKRTRVELGGAARMQKVERIDGLRGTAGRNAIRERQDMLETSTRGGERNANAANESSRSKEKGGERRREF
jgi:hypothetical protein